jgi:diguanylate cyclase (GGDEF)-like protein
VNETLAHRLRQLPRTARRALASREALAEWRASLEGVRTPADVGRAVVERLHAWLPLDQWTLAAVTGSDRLAIVAHSGARLRRRRLTEALAEVAVARGTHVGWPTATAELVRGPDVAAIAWILTGRQDPVGVIVGCDDGPSARVPAAAAAAEALTADVLRPVGLALEVATRLDRLQQIAAIDDLTGLYNARYLHQAIDREIHRLARTARPVSLIFMDLDAFKRVNDSHGHLMGSRTLVEFGNLLQSCTRATDTVARYGGDEFVVVLPEADRRQARLVARRIQERTAAAVFLQSCGLRVRLTVSLGLATLTQPTRTASDLIRMADEAMYWVKHHGRNGIRAFRRGGPALRGR